MSIIVLLWQLGHRVCAPTMFLSMVACLFEAGRQSGGDPAIHHRDRAGGAARGQRNRGVRRRDCTGLAGLAGATSGSAPPWPTESRGALRSISSRRRSPVEGGLLLPPAAGSPLSASAHRRFGAGPPPHAARGHAVGPAGHNQELEKVRQAGRSPEADCRGRFGSSRLCSRRKSKRCWSVARL